MDSNEKLREEVLQGLQELSESKRGEIRYLKGVIHKAETLGNTASGGFSGSLRNQCYKTINTTRRSIARVEKSLAWLEEMLEKYQ